MTSTTMVHVRIDEDTKAQATQTLAALGLSVSDAVRIFLKRVVVEQGLPLSLKVPNAETQAAMREARAISDLRFSDPEDLIRAIEEDIRGETGRSSTEN